MTNNLSASDFRKGDVVELFYDFSNSKSAKYTVVGVDANRLTYVTASATNFADFDYVNRKFVSFVSKVAR